MENDFLKELTDIIEENISNEKFGVSELAHKAGMSRSNLLRKVKKAANLSVSQFIRQVRLERAMEMLKAGSFNVSEVSYKVGFGSTSYFIKCFHDHYGYPPGEVGRHETEETEAAQPESPQAKKGAFGLLEITGVVVTLAVALFFVFRSPSPRTLVPEKSIAVLPFINDSSDSSNVYIVNGLMESILNNLQKIEDLRVVSRTSVEKYRNNPKTISEISRELDVNYFVEGSGQKVDDQIQLNIQLIEASTDNHLWSEQYNREISDIFELQREIAKAIADQIQAIITPEEEKRIDKPPTDNLMAYDSFLKGLDYLNMGTRDGLEEAIPLFHEAVEQDPEFALAYADIAIAYYFLDYNQVEKQYSDQVNYYADQALLNDPELAQSLIAKSLFYIQNGEYTSALPHLEKALEYNPNSATVVNILSNFYTNYIPNTEKYLEYALKGIQIDIAAQDSVNASYTYLHVGNALAQTGFVDEAEHYINQSLEYNPNNLFSEYVKAYILYAKEKNLVQARRRLVQTLQKDPNRPDVMQEAAKICYFMGDYECAYQYYSQFLEIRSTQHLDIYRGEDAKIAFVLSKMGLHEESENLFRDYKVYAENDQSIYRHLSLAVFYSHEENIERALEEMRLFSQEENYHYWILLFLKLDPLLDPIKNLSEFEDIYNTIENKFWENQREMKASLEEKNLL